MKLEHLVTYLSTRLSEDLPGESAHNLMKPRLVNGAPLNIKQTSKPREGGVLILLYEEEGKVRFPLIQRPEYNGIHSGQIAFPGGKKENFDVSLEETALRESEEEIGVSRKKVQVIGHLSKFFVAASNYDVLPVVGYIREKPSFVPDEREVSSIITPQALELIDSENRLTKNITVRNGFQLNSPYYHLENKVVWGATAMMLSELVAILREFHLD